MSLLLLAYAALIISPVLGSFNALFSRASFISGVKKSTITISNFTNCSALANATAFNLSASFDASNSNCSRLLAQVTSSPSSAEIVPLHPLTLGIGRLLCAVPVLAFMYHRELQQEKQDAAKAAAAGKPDTGSKVTPSLMDFLWVCLLGFIGVGLNFFFYLLGVSLLSGVASSGWSALMPAVSFVMAFMMGYEGFSGLKLASIVIVITGNVFLSHLWRIFTDESPAGAVESSSFSLQATLLGCFAMLMNTVCFSFFLVGTKPLSGKFSIVRLTLIAQTVGLATLLFISLIPTENIVSAQLLSLFFDTGTRLAPISWVAILYAGLVHSTITYYLLGFGIKHTGKPVLASVTGNLQPVIICVEVMVFLDEKMDAYQMLGGVIVLGGIVLSMWISWQESQKQSLQNEPKTDIKQQLQQQEPAAPVAESTADGAPDDKADKAAEEKERKRKEVASEAIASKEEDFHIEIPAGIVPALE